MPTCVMLGQSQQSFSHAPRAFSAGIVSFMTCMEMPDCTCDVSIGSSGQPNSAACSCALPQCSTTLTWAFPFELSPELIEVFATGFVSTRLSASDSPSPARTCRRSTVVEHMAVLCRGYYTLPKLLLHLRSSSSTQAQAKGSAGATKLMHTRKYLFRREDVGNCSSAAPALFGAHIHRKLQQNTRLLINTSPPDACR